MSKLLPSELFPYAKYFYGNYPSREEVRKCPPEYRMTAVTKEEIKVRFDEAWLFHQHRNPHHWQYWILREDSGVVKLIDVPDSYLEEMLCDWEGAGLAITGSSDWYGWYLKNKDRMLLSEQTKLTIQKYGEQESCLRS